MKIEKKGLIFSLDKECSWWKHSTLAPCALLLDDNTIRVYFGARDNQGVSRITYMDLDAKEPKNIKKIHDKPILDIGNPGSFDENGVFPASVTKINDKIYLYYTGVQLGIKVRYYMFCGLAISDDGENFSRISEAPVMDRSDEGLITRSGITILYEDGIYKSWYSSGNSWEKVGGIDRPNYDIFYCESKDGIEFPKKGIRCIKYNKELEHGLGRPQIIKNNDNYYIFYTTRNKDMRYGFDVSKSQDAVNWERINLKLQYSDSSWDSEMIYFPSFVSTKNKDYIFYCGNNYGRAGFGYSEILEW